MTTLAEEDLSVLLDKVQGILDLSEEISEETAREIIWGLQFTSREHLVYVVESLQTMLDDCVVKVYSDTLSWLPNDFSHDEEIPYNPSWRERRLRKNLIRDARVIAEAREREKLTAAALHKEELRRKAAVNVRNRRQAAEAAEVRRLANAAEAAEERRLLDVISRYSHPSQSANEELMNALYNSPE